MPNRAAKLRKQDRATKNASIKKYKRDIKRIKVVKVTQDDGHWYNKTIKK